MKPFLLIALPFLFLVALAAGAWLFVPRQEPEAAMAFINMYAQYDELVAKQERVVYEPGHARNVDRKKLYASLASVLTKDLTASARLAKAQTARKQVAVIREEIDAVAASREAVEQTIDRVEMQLTQFETAQLARKANAIVDLMRERQRIIADLTATLYAINNHADEIMARIIDHDGRLPDEHIERINTQTDIAEDRFERLTSLYRRLSDTTEELQRAYRRFVATAL